MTYKRFLATLGEGVLADWPNGAHEAFHRLHALAVTLLY